MQPSHFIGLAVLVLASVFVLNTLNLALVGHTLVTIIFAD